MDSCVNRKNTVTVLNEWSGRRVLNVPGTWRCVVLFSGRRTRADLLSDVEIGSLPGGLLPYIF